MYLKTLMNNNSLYKEYIDCLFIKRLSFTMVLFNIFTSFLSIPMYFPYKVKFNYIYPYIESSYTL